MAFHHENQKFLTRTLPFSVLLALCAAAPLRASTTNDHPIAGRTWTGEWSNLRGFVYEARMALSVGEDGAVSGSILWTLRVSPRAWEKDKLGQTGVEHVRGVWSEADGSLVFEGVAKDDPCGILGLDSYRLALADTGRLIGVTRSYDPDWGGLFVLDPVPLLPPTAAPSVAEDPWHE